jgi:reactive chlorine resistance protein C
MSTMNLTNASQTSISLSQPVLSSIANRVQAVSNYMLRYSLVVILLWIGAMKFTSVEAQAIRPFVENSPFFSWTYPIFGVQGLSNILGTIELLVGLMIATRPWFPRLSALGSLFAVGMFLSTLSFLITTPGAWADEIGGFPAIGVVGQFLIKDLALLGIAIWSVGEAIRAAQDPQTR